MTRSCNFHNEYFPWDVDSTCQVSCHLLIISLNCGNLNKKFQILKCDPGLNSPESGVIIEVLDSIVPHSVVGVVNSYAV